MAVERNDAAPSVLLISITSVTTAEMINSVSAKLAFSSSRSKLVAYIEAGKVFVNGKLITSNRYQIKENDIVFFLTDDHVPVIHRYIATTDQGELITKGDANPMEDSDPVSLDQVFGKVIKVF